MARRLVLGLFLVLACALPSWAAPDAYTQHKKQHKPLKEREATYWDEFRDRLTRIYQEWSSERRLWRSDPEYYKDETHDLQTLRDLYAEYVEIQESLNEIDRAFATSGHDKVLAHLLDELMDLAKSIDQTEKELDEGNPTGGGGRYEQEPAVRRHGQDVRLRGIVEALAAAPGASAFLRDKGLAKAAKGDKKRSTVRQTAVLDVLGLIADDVARPLLEARLASPRPFLRIVAAENLVGANGPDVRDALQPLLEDPSRAVQRALLDAVRTRAADVPGWIPLIVATYETREGLVQERALLALEALTGQAIGHDVKRWKEWFVRNESAIRQGTFRRPEPAPEKKEGGEDAKDGAPKEDEKEKKADGDDAGKKAPPPRPRPAVDAALTFYGVPSASANAAFVLNGSSDMDLPADLATQTRWSRTHWLQTGPKWKREHPDQRTVLLEQLEATLSSMPDGARFGVVHLYGSTPGRVGVFGGKKLLKASRGTTKSVVKGIAKPKPQGQLSSDEGLRQAFALSNTDPFEDPKDPDAVLDTVFLLDTGWIGGRWGLPEAQIAAFERTNRFRRLVVRVIRIGDRKEDAAMLLEGLAESSGGSYLWLETLP